MSLTLDYILLINDLLPVFLTCENVDWKLSGSGAVCFRAKLMLAGKGVAEPLLQLCPCGHRI